METLILHLLFWIVNHGPLDRPKRVNETITQAEKALQRKDYTNASRQFRYLVDSLRFTKPAARLDLAHSMFEGKDTLNARLQYQRLDSVTDVQARSVALQQLGVLAGNRNANEQALAYFKRTLQADPTNEDARYDYELLKKKINKEKQQEEQQKKNPNNQEPSEFAKRLKAQAEALVLERRYQEASNLMQDGLKKDQTVSAFNDFTKRIQKVAQINR